MKRAAFPAVVALVAGLIVPTAGVAQEASPAPPAGDCPPGSWFCATPPEEPQPAGQPAKEPDPVPPPPTPLPNPDATPGPAAAPAPSQTVGAPETPPPHAPPPPAPPSGTAPGWGPPPWGPPPPYEWGPTYPPPPYAYGEPGYRRSPAGMWGPRAWGIDAHLEAATFGHGSAAHSGMGGAGLGVRFRPLPHFGLEADLDFVGGTDYQGDDRHETALSVSGLFFLNPRSLAQLYLLGGFGFSGARVDCDAPTLSCPIGATRNYGYFGAQFGGGIELRLSHLFAIHTDLRGFFRGRTDASARIDPEFVSASGQTTNASGGALLTAGTTFYF